MNDTTPTSLNRIFLKLRNNHHAIYLSPGPGLGSLLDQAQLCTRDMPGTARRALLLGAGAARGQGPELEEGYAAIRLARGDVRDRGEVGSILLGERGYWAEEGCTAEEDILLVGCARSPTFGDSDAWQEAFRRLLFEDPEAGKG